MDTIPWAVQEAGIAFQGQSMGPQVVGVPVFNMPVYRDLDTGEYRATTDEDIRDGITGVTFGK